MRSPGQHRSIAAVRTIGPVITSWTTSTSSSASSAFGSVLDHAATDSNRCATPMILNEQFEQFTTDHPESTATQQTVAGPAHRAQ